MKYLNKRGMEITYYTVIFLILNLLFISGMMYFVYSSKNNSLFLEQVYAKEIALFLDSAKPGMEIIFNMDKAFDVAKENNRESEIVVIDQENNEIHVILKKTGGYNITYFTENKIILKENIDKKRIYLKVEKNEE